jgi:deazaflavin-dependent oxidoreductase (nitroreductase family)
VPAPRWLARVNFRFTNRLLAPIARRLPGMGIVVHTGRKSEREYRTPVIIFRRGQQVVIALTYGRESQWVKNVLASGGCKLETQGTTLRLSHPRIFHDERRFIPAFFRQILGLLNVSDFLEMAVGTNSGRS